MDDIQNNNPENGTGSDNDIKSGTIHLPASKSIGARFLMASYFGETLPADPMFEDSDDLRVLQDVLLVLYTDEEPIDFGSTPLDVHASGTAMRFVTAACASTPEADYIVTGTPRVCERPMQPLISLLREAGAVIQTQGKNETGPYRITGKELEGGEFSIRGDISSQFISALMLCAPSWRKGMTLNFTTPPVSYPYIDMTAKVMDRLGVKVKLSQNGVTVPHADYHTPEDFKIEPDWSAASFFYEAAAISGSRISIEGLVAPDKSLQGDSAAAELFGKLGVRSEFSETDAVLIPDGSKAESMEENLKDNPDLVPPLVVACAMNEIKFNFTGVATLRSKESDRLTALQKELHKLGYDLKIEDDAISWDGKKNHHKGDKIDTYDDHRIAMSFTMVALKTGEIKISDPDTVDKSFSDFWNQVPHLGLSCTRHDDLMIVKRDK